MMGDGGGRSIDEFVSSSTGSIILILILIVIIVILLLLIGTNANNNKNTMHDTKTQRWMEGYVFCCCSQNQKK